MLAVSGNEGKGRVWFARTILLLASHASTSGLLQVLSATERQGIVVVNVMSLASSSSVASPTSQGRGGYGNGFYVPYEVRTAPGKGRGLFATAHIPEGTLIWHGDDDVCTFYDEPELLQALSTLTREEARYKLNHLYSMKEVHPDRVIDLAPVAALVNHSSMPNSVTPYVYEAATGRCIDPSAWPLPTGQVPYVYNACVALRDIVAGEELLEDYGEFHNPEWYAVLCEQYDTESAACVASKYE